MPRWDFMLVVPRDEEDRAKDIMIKFETEDATFEYECDHNYKGVTRFFFRSLIGGILDVINAFHANKLTTLN